MGSNTAVIISKASQKPAYEEKEERSPSVHRSCLKMSLLWAGWRPLSFGAVGGIRTFGDHRLLVMQVVGGFCPGRADDIPPTSRRPSSFMQEGKHWQVDFVDTRTDMRATMNLQLLVAAPEMGWPLAYTWVRFFRKPGAFGFLQQQTLFCLSISLLLWKS